MVDRYKLEILSPVHIGSGDKWQKDFDYFTDKTGSFLLDKERFFDSLSDDQINEATNSDNIVRFAEAHSINLKQFSKERLSASRIDTNEINEYIKDSFETPYIPGSSIKGAIRTVLANHIIQIEELKLRYNQRAKKEWAFSDMNKTIFGADHHKDFLRGLMVVDCFFKPTDLAVMLSKVYTLDRQNQLMVKRTSRDNPKSQMMIYGQCLKEKASSDITLKIDDNLFKKFSKKLEIKANRYEALKDFANIANQYAAKKIESEAAFYQNTDLRFLKIFYQSLLEKVNSLKEDSFVLNVGWGSGWHFKTGDYMSDDQLDNVRSSFDLGKIDKRCPANHYGRDLKYDRKKDKFYCKKCNKEYFPENIKTLIKPFPKSRKIMFNEQRLPSSTPGWILLSKIAPE
jgi:CRISPR-associated protein Csm5